MAQDLPVGSILAGYRIVSVIGRGGMGVVYLAEHAGLGRQVAVKVLAPELGADANFRARFERESRVAASLDHPNVIPIYEAGEADGVLFIAMRYVAGPDLRQLLGQEGRFEPRRGLGIVAQIASALDAAHGRGLIHRDVKPGNVLVAQGLGADGNEHIYLTDFGLTKHSSSKTGLTQLGQMVGTIDYISPEQISGGTVDARADVYALGCVLYELLTGRPPYARDSDLAVMAAHLLEPPPMPSTVAPQLAALDEVIGRAMAKRPDERYPSASALALAARAALAGGGTSPAPPTYQPTVITGPAPVAAWPPAQPPPAPAPSAPAMLPGPRTGLAAAVVAIALLLGGGAGFVLTGPAGTATPTPRTGVSFPPVTFPPVSLPPVVAPSPTVRLAPVVTEPPVSEPPITPSPLVSEAPVPVKTLANEGEAVRRLIARLPASHIIPTSCIEDDQWPGAIAQVVCTPEDQERRSDETGPIGGAAPALIYIAEFPDDATVGARFDQLVRDQDATGLADCANGQPGRDDTVRGDAEESIGELACYVDLSIPTLIWREDGSPLLRTISDYRSPDLSDLFRWWRSFPTIP